MKSHALTLLFVGSVSSLLLAVSPARALAVYTEASNGDLSNDGLHPTSIAVEPGSNQVFGTTGRSGAIDVDYFTFVVPSGYAWSALELLPGTVAGGSLSFIGLEAGNQVTVSASAADATGLLGWTHYGSGAIDADLLPFMSAPSLGSTGFTPPLAAGAYALWVQDFNVGTFAYGFDVQVTPVPEPDAAALVLLALGVSALAAGILSRLSDSRRILAR